MGLESAIFFRDQGSGCTIFVGSGTTIAHAFGIKDQKFAHKSWISIKKHTSLPPCYLKQKKLGVRNTQNKCSALYCRVCFESHDIPFCFEVPAAPVYNILWSVYYRMYSAQVYSRAGNWFA